MKKEKKLAQDILQQIGGGENIQSLNYCMTRLRLDLRDRSKVNMSALKNIDGVMGVVDDETLQIIVGPGVVNKVASEISEITDVKLGEALDVQEDDVAALTKAQIKKKNETPLKNLLRKIGNIFIPLIPGLVASGLINGAVGFAKNAGVDPTLTWVQILSL